MSGMSGRGEKHNVIFCFSFERRRMVFSGIWKIRRSVLPLSRRSEMSGMPCGERLNLSGFLYHGHYIIAQNLVSFAHMSVEPACHCSLHQQGKAVVSTL